MKDAVRFYLAGAVALLALAGCTHPDKRTMAVQDGWHGTTLSKKVASGKPRRRAPESRGRPAAINAAAHAPWCVTQRGSGIQADCTYDDFMICDMAASVAGGTCKARSNLIAPRLKAAVPSPPQRKLSLAEHDKLLAGSDSDSCASCHRTRPLNRHESGL